MARGRNICNTLKAIRKQIADANGISYSPDECHFEGECKGT
ncbi:TonB-dependent receptor, partial [Prevotella copri]|nr:TonB-dependent receptor [Segatella copri]